MGAGLHHDFPEQTLLHPLPINLFLEPVNVELEGMVEGFLRWVMALPIERRKFLRHVGVHPAAQGLTGGVLHHGDHSFSCELGSDSADVGLALLKILESHVNGTFSYHFLNLQIEAREQSTDHFPEVLTRQWYGDVPRKLLAVCGEELLFNLFGLCAVEITNRVHETYVEVTGFESSSAEYLPCLV